jgi:hypothetical protein
MELRDKKNNNLSVFPRKWTKYYGLATCPGDILGWLRIPAEIIFIIGVLGIAKDNLSFWYKLLRPLHFPPMEWCWVLLAISITFYLFHIIKTRDARNRFHSTGTYDQPTVPQRWRSF